MASNKINYKYTKAGNDEFKRVKATAKELKEARTKALKLINKNPTKVGWRSCWVCNAAHIHFLNGKWGKWVLNCLQCGHFYFDKIDITEF